MNYKNILAIIAIIAIAFAAYTFIGMDSEKAEMMNDTATSTDEVVEDDTNATGTEVIVEVVAEGDAE